MLLSVCCLFQWEACEIPWQLCLTHLRDAFPECSQRHVTAWGYAIRAWVWGHKASWACWRTVLGRGSQTWSILTYSAFGRAPWDFFQSNKYLGSACAWPLISWYRPLLTSDDISGLKWITAIAVQFSYCISPTEQTLGCLANRVAKI